MTERDPDEENERTVQQATRIVRLGGQVKRAVLTPVLVFASVLGAASLVLKLALYPFASDGTKAWVDSTVVSVAALGGLVWALYLQSRYIAERDEARDARRLRESLDSLVKFHELLARVTIEHVARDGRAGMSAVELAQTGDAAMNHLASAFSVLTGRPCRAAVKVPSQTGGGVVDLFRSHRTSKRASLKEPAPIEKNTDFAEALTSPQRHWVSNDICVEPSFQDSHLKRSDILARSVPYRSVMTWAILDSDEEEDPEILGFLCLDSPSLGTFKRELPRKVARSSAHILRANLEAAIKPGESANSGQA